MTSNESVATGATEAAGAGKRGLILLPAVDVVNGQAVRLVQGKIGRAHV